jgi:hypothetical protein
MSKQNSTMWFDPNVWSIIKEFAGYSSDYPIDLPYVKYMLNLKGSDCLTKIKWKKVISLDHYIYTLWQEYEMYESILQCKFNPIKWR